jgi:abhydrolase domain-containing protein 13
MDITLAASSRKALSNSSQPGRPTMAANFFSYLRLPVIASSGLAALGSGLLYFKQNEIIYPRNLPAGARTQVPEPKDFHIENSESLQIPTPDNESLHAYLLRPPNVALRKNVTILMFHGNAGNVGHRLPIGKVLSESLGCNVFMLEYRGYGLSTGVPDENGLAIDAQTALDYIRARAELRDTKLLIYGQSLGGAVTIRLVAENQKRGDIAGVMLENTFTSIRKLIPTAFPPAKYISRLCHQLWPSDETLPKVTANIPMLFLSGLKDEIVPAPMMKTLYNLCNVDRKVWKTFPNGHHNDTVAEPGYFDAIWAFLVQDVLSEEVGGDDQESTDVSVYELWG